MFIPNAPAESYWEGEWKFPRTGTTVSIAIAIAGSEDGPFPETREFLLGVPPRFDQIIQTLRPRLADLFRAWLDQELPADIFKVVKLAGLSVDDPRIRPIHWDISFEAIGDKWLGIVIPFSGDEAQEAIVDT